MRKLSLTLFSIGAAACGSDAAKTPDAAKAIDAKPIDAPKVFLDAPPAVYDFSCMGNAAPTTAAASISMSGVVTQVDVQGMTPVITPLDGATLDGCKAGAANCTNANHYGTQVTSAGGGLFSIGPFDTGALPVDAYVTMTKTGDRDARVFPAGPLAANQSNIPVLTFTNPGFTALNGFFQLGQQTANGTVGMLIADCASMPITDTANITLSVKQNGAAVTGTKTLDVSTINPMAAGLFIVSNVPPGATVVGAKYKTMDLRAHTISVVATTTSETIVRPGY